MKELGRNKNNSRNSLNRNRRGYSRKIRPPNRYSGISNKNSSIKRHTYRSLRPNYTCYRKSKPYYMQKKKNPGVGPIVTLTFAVLLIFMVVSLVMSMVKAN